MQNNLTAGAEAAVGTFADRDPIHAARADGIDISLINSLLDLPVIERIRRNDADALLDRMLRGWPARVPRDL